MQIPTYLDWNVFNKIEKQDQLDVVEKEIYSKIEEQVLNGTLIAPYSNAHISDLARGYLKNPDFTEGHLKTIERLTQNLCIVQYWSEQKVKWHYREPKEFLDSTLEETDMTAGSFAELLYMDGEPLVNSLWDLQKTVMRIKRVDESFKEIYKLDPVFNQIFPRTKTEMNQLSLCEDLFQFSFRIKIDFALYRNFQKFLTQMRLKMPQYQKMITKTQQKVIGKPHYLDWDKLVDESAVQFKNTSPNAAYDKIINLFTSTDLKGYSQDERFANMIDDALHCFYGAHCQYFVTNDKRCSDKAKKVYEKLKLPSFVVTPAEFYSILSNNQTI
jgi:hypothetical protein